MDSATLAKQLQEYDAKKVTSTDALNEALGQYGVPEIRKNVSGLRTTLANTTNALNSVDPSVTGRTSGSLVTEAQRQRQVVNERAPIAQQLQSQGGQLNDQERILQDALGQANTLATNKVNDYTRGRDALQSQYELAYKREQDDAARKAAELQAAEEQRRFNLELATKQATKAPSKVDASGAAGQLVGYLDKKKGRDGYLSPYDYNNAKSAWAQDGYNVAQFDAIFGKYKNPKQPKGQYK